MRDIMASLRRKEECKLEAQGTSEVHEGSMAVGGAGIAPKPILIWVPGF